jgi:ABC-type polysaccharide/polyol phosphate export permease
VYLILVSVVLHRGGQNTGLTLACAVVAFQLVMMTVVNALDAVALRGSILTNMPFPRRLIPTASAVTEGLAFSANLSLLGLMMAIYGVAPTPAILWLPLVFAVNFALATALAYPAALVGLLLGELRPLAVSLVRALFFISPGLVSLQTIGGDTEQLLKLNPLTGLVEAYRAILIDGAAPAAWELLIPLAAAALVAAIFVPIYAREQPQFAKVL